MGMHGCEIDDSGIQVTFGRYFDRFFAKYTVAYYYQLILKRPDPNATPGDALNHSGSAIGDRNNIADLKYLVSMHCDAGKQIAERILYR
jgi:hypothetical protein